MNGMPLRRENVRVNHNGCRTVGKDLPPKCKLYCPCATCMFWSLVHQYVKPL